MRMIVVTTDSFPEVFGGRRTWLCFDSEQTQKGRVAALINNTSLLLGPLWKDLIDTILSKYHSNHKKAVISSPILRMSKQRLGASE